MQMQKLMLVTKQDEANHTASTTEKPRLKQGDIGFAVAQWKGVEHALVHKFTPVLCLYQGTVVNSPAKSTSAQLNSGCKHTEWQM